MHSKYQLKIEALGKIFPIGALTGKIFMEDNKTIWQAGGYINMFTMGGVQ